ncbi:MAG TPA: hypothetical protein VOA87_05350, partial [Thermoanaerobaculia bacterium]|nr:hypothetical protein [Thermoanaerobaculia bacterium]
GPAGDVDLTTAAGKVLEGGGEVDPCHGAIFIMEAAPASRPFLENENGALSRRSTTRLDCSART